MNSDSLLFYQHSVTQITVRPVILPYFSIDNAHPKIFVTPFDVWITEEFFKSTYVASSNTSNIESDEEFLGFE
jgi:hypothetical protein